MIPEPLNPKPESKQTSASVGEARAFASELIAQASDGASFDARSVLSRHPELQRFKSAVLDLAYEEYCRRIEVGSNVNPYEFAALFPDYSRSLLRLIQLHGFFEDNVHLLKTTAVTWPSLGDTFLGFSLVEELGRGALSRVYLAKQPALGNRSVAVKLSVQGNWEAQTLGQLQHPHIVPVYSVQCDEQSGLTAICMPFLSRATLFDVLDLAFSGSDRPRRSGVIAEAISRANQDAESDPGGASLEGTGETKTRRSYINAAIRLGLQLAEALAHTHRRGICHSDIKPSNVLLAPDGKAMLFDFNLAYAEQLSGGNVVGGTLPYMAPEQLRHVAARGAPEETTVINAQTDLFCFGATFYELLCGRLPFGRIPTHLSKRGIAEELLRRQRLGPRPLRQANDGVNKSLAQIVESCLAFDPARRPPSAESLGQALRSQLSPTRRTRRWIRAHRRLTLAMLFVSLLIAIGIGRFRAMREPYVDHHFRLGCLALSRQEYKLAAEHFTCVLKAEPDYVEAWFARGRVHLAVGRLEEAHHDFSETDDRIPEANGRLTACIAHYYACKAFRHGDRRAYTTAIRLYEKAINERFSYAAVYNNIAFCCFELGEYDRAETQAKAAIYRDQRIQSAHHILLIADQAKSIDEKCTPNTRYVEDAIRLFPEGAHLLLDAACNYALAARRASEAGNEGVSLLVDRTLDCCESAVQQGVAPARLKEVASFYGPLSGESRFREIATYARPTVEPIPPVWLVDPLEGLGEPPLLNAR